MEKKSYYRSVVCELAREEKGLSEASMGDLFEFAGKLAMRLASDPAFLASCMALGAKRLKAQARKIRFAR